MTGPPDFGPKPSKQGAVLIELLRSRPHAVGAEIGVNHGETQLHLLRHLPRLERLYAVDPWTAYPDYRRSLSKAKWRDQATFDGVLTRYLGRLLEFDVAGVVRILAVPSRLAARCIPDESLDWVFIDGNHSYEYVREDIDLWTPRVKPGGVVAGHDYLKRPGWGVIRAVGERFGDRVRTEKHDVWWVERS